MLVRKENVTASDWEAGMTTLTVFAIETVEANFGEGVVQRAQWTFADAANADRKIRGWCPLKFTANSRFMTWLCAAFGCAFDRLPDELDAELAVGRRVLARVEVNEQGRAKVADIMPLPKATATPAKPTPAANLTPQQPASATPQRAQRPSSPDFEEAVDGESEDDIPF